MSVYIFELAEPSREVKDLVKSDHVRWLKFSEEDRLSDDERHFLKLFKSYNIQPNDIIALFTPHNKPTTMQGRDGTCFGFLEAANNYTKKECPIVRIDFADNSDKIVAQIGPKEGFADAQIVTFMKIARYLTLFSERNSRDQVLLQLFSDASQKKDLRSTLADGAFRPPTSQPLYTPSNVPTEKLPVTGPTAYPVHQPNKSNHWISSAGFTPYMGTLTVFLLCSILVLQLTRGKIEGLEVQNGALAAESERLSLEISAQEALLAEQKVQIKKNAEEIDEQDRMVDKLMKMEYTILSLFNERAETVREIRNKNNNNNNDNNNNNAQYVAAQ